MKFKKVLEVLNEMIENSIIKDFAIFGGYAVTFYSEPILTYDLDILFEPVPETKIEILSDIYSWLRKKGFSIPI